MREREKSAKNTLTTQKIDILNIIEEVRNDLLHVT